MDAKVFRREKDMCRDTVTIIILFPLGQREILLIVFKKFRSSSAF